MKEPTEHQIQTAFIEWCRLKAIKDNRFQNIIAIPNAGLRSWRSGKKLKDEGMAAGFPDVFVFVPSRGYSGLGIEFKTKKGKVRENQSEWINRLNQAGYFATIVRSVDEAILAVEMYLK